MGQVLMPKATAVWLIENTALTFDQVAEFCGLHPLEVQSIADGEVAIGMAGFDPISSGQLTQEEIDRCSADATQALQMAEINVPRPTTRTKGPRYTPVARRQDRPDGIAWLLRNFPELSDGQIARLVGTTKPTINGIRDRSHWNIANIKPRDPVALGLCAREDLSAAIDKARRAVERAEKRKAKEKAKAEGAAAATGAADAGDAGGEGKPIESEADIPGIVAEPVADSFTESPPEESADAAVTPPEPQATPAATDEPPQTVEWPPTDR
jgi:hypothetical protein